MLADEGLIREYFRLHKTDNLGINNQYKDTEDRIRVVSNPRYQEEKDFAKVPCGMVIIDGKLIGIELIDRNDPRKFKAGILLRDEIMCAAMKEYYQKIWDYGYSDLAKLREQFIDK